MKALCRRSRRIWTVHQMFGGQTILILMSALRITILVSNVVCIAEGPRTPHGNLRVAVLETSQGCVACRSSIALQKLSIMSVQGDGWFSRVTHQRCQAKPSRVRCLSPYSQPPMDLLSTAQLVGSCRWLKQFRCSTRRSMK